MWPRALPFQDYHEARRGAKRHLPKALFDYIDRGTEAETALDRLRQGFDTTRFVPQVLRQVAAPDLSARFGGQARATPWVIAPTALAGLVRHGGEGLVAKAAAQAGVPFCVATQSSSSVEDIRKAAPEAELWFQLYPWEDEEATQHLIARARACGVKTLVVTMDTPGSPKKVHNVRNGFGIPLRPSWRLGVDCLCHPRWSLGVAGRYLLQGGIPAYAHYPAEAAGSIRRAISDPRFALRKVISRDWLARLRASWRGQLVVKGVLCPTETAQFREIGCDGLVISSHGGRNLDACVTPLEMLPAIRAAAGPMWLLADSGVKRGSDAAKLIAAGADGVQCGRWPLYALSCGGSEGVVRALQLLSQELSATMEFVGAERLPTLRDRLHKA